MVSSLHYLTTQKESVAKSGVWDESEGRKVFRDKEGVMTVLPPCIALLCIAASMTRMGENQPEAVRRAHTTRPISMNALHNERPTPFSFNLRHQAWARGIVAVLLHAHRAPAPARAVVAQAVKAPRKLKSAYVYTLHLSE